MNIQSQLRHLLSFLAGLGAIFLSWNIIAPDQVAAVNAAGGQLIEPLLVIIGAAAVFIFRVVMDRMGARLSGGKDATYGKDSGGGRNGPLPLFVIFCAGLGLVMGFSLVSCESFQGAVSYTDLQSGVSVTAQGNGTNRKGAKVAEGDAKGGMPDSRPL